MDPDTPDSRRPLPARIIRQVVPDLSGRRVGRSVQGAMAGSVGMVLLSQADTDFPTTAQLVVIGGVALLIVGMVLMGLGSAPKGVEHRPRQRKRPRSGASAGGAESGAPVIGEGVGPLSGFGPPPGSALRASLPPLAGATLGPLEVPSPASPEPAAPDAAAPDVVAEAVTEAAEVAPVGVIESVEEADVAIDLRPTATPAMAGATPGAAPAGASHASAAPAGAAAAGAAAGAAEDGGSVERVGPPPAPLPSAGWYADPTDPGRRRWWDGRDWTEHTA
jgi:hypothetical protein